MKKTPPKDTDNKIVIKDGAMLKCFLMRFRGYTYAQIEESLNQDSEVKIKYGGETLENYFSVNGKWYETYTKWRDAQVASITDQVHNAFVAQAIQANQQIVKMAGGILVVEYRNRRGALIRKNVPLNGKVVLNANQDLLDRAGFKPVERIQSTDAEDMAEKIVKRYEAIGKKKSKK